MPKHKRTDGSLSDTAVSSIDALERQRNQRMQARGQGPPGAPGPGGPGGGGMGKKSSSTSQLSAAGMVNRPNPNTRARPLNAVAAFPANQTRLGSARIGGLKAKKRPIFLEEPVSASVLTSLNLPHGWLRSVNIKKLTPNCSFSFPHSPWM